MQIPDLHDNTDMDAYLKYHQEIMSGKEITSEANILRKDGKKVLTEFNNSRLIISDTSYMHSVARDISDRKRAERKLLSLNKQLKKRGQQLLGANQQLEATNQQLLDREQSLKMSEERYRTLFENNPIGL